MKRALLLIVFGVLVFAGIVIARLPASWFAPGPRSQVTCADVDGTIWNGACTGLAAQGQALGDLSWQINAARLLAARLNADLVLTRPDGTLRGTLEVGFDRKIVAHNIQADLPLDHGLMPQLPPTLHGHLHADIATLRLQRNVIKAIEGEIQARDLTDGIGPGAQAWGSYAVNFPPSTGGDPIGQLRDLGGPLAVKGSLRLTHEPPGFDLECVVKAQPSAAPQLAQEIQFLGQPDAQGFRPFGMSASF